MESKKNISWEQVIRITAIYMKENNLNDLKINENISNSNGVWGKLSQLYFNSQFNQNDALFLSKNWERNRNGYKTKVLNILKGNFLNDSKINYAEIKINNFDWTNLQQYISNDKTKRKYFTGSFDRFLAIKMQENGLKCWAKCIYNTFPKKNKDLLWKGKYICKECKIEFSASIINIPGDITICFSWNNEIRHEQKVPEDKIRITGERRSNMRYEVKAIGVENYMAEQYQINQSIYFL